MNWERRGQLGALCYFGRKVCHSYLQLLAHRCCTSQAGITAGPILHCGRNPCDFYSIEFRRKAPADGISE